MSGPAEPTLEAFDRHPVGRYMAATRPAFLSVTLVACLIGLASAHGTGVSIDPLNACLTVLFALVAHAGGNVINDYHDDVSGADAVNTERLFPFTGGSRFIQNGVLTRAGTARFGYGLLAVVIPAGLYLAWQSGPGLIAIGLAGMLVGWAYSAPPLKLMARGLGEFGVTAAWLIVVIGADFVQRGSFSPLPAMAGLSYALLVANILYINQFPDHRGDAAAGKLTLVVLLGPPVAKWGYLLIAIVAYGWLVAMVAGDHVPQKCAAAALTLVLSFRAGRDLIAHAATPSELGNAIKLTIAAANIHGLLLAGMLAFARWPGAVGT